MSDHKQVLSQSRRIYLDHAAATPLHPSVRAAMEPYMDELFANPSAIHTEGRAARQAVEDSRAIVARLLGIRSDGVVFTSCGTEANNLALYGYFARLTASNAITLADCELITTTTEHPSVLRVVEDLQTRGLVVRYVPVDAEGLIDARAFAAALNERTALVTFAYANSEVGVVQDVKKLTHLVRRHNHNTDSNVVVHLDASQVPLWLSCELPRLGVDLLTLDAGKCNGPKGVGVLARRHGVELFPILLGGGQELGLRAGTEAVAGIVGATTALSRAQASHEERSAAVAPVRDHALALLQDLPEVVVNGSLTQRLPNNINISIPGFDSEYAVVVLDAHGIAASTKSACSGAGSGGSSVVAAMTGDSARAGATIRFSLGEETTTADMETAVQALRQHVAAQTPWANIDK